MENKTLKKSRLSRILSVIMIALGAILLIYMITVEDEPGALPLLLIVVGSVWLFVNRYQIRKQTRTE